MKWFYKTPLHLAVEKGYPEIIKLLLENKRIDIHSKDCHGKEPIDYATNNHIKQLFNRWLKSLLKLFFF